MRPLEQHGSIRYFARIELYKVSGVKNLGGWVYMMLEVKKVMTFEIST